ncbi:unnamed protein product [Auanema sp. JU1783]|nr:unnamed protein product [Auanema sp. JU1783]
MILLIVLTILIIFIFNEFFWKRRPYPPGPMPLPIVGNMNEIAKIEPGYDAFLKWRDIYGPVYTVWLGVEPVVVVADYPTIKDSFIRDGEVFQDKLKFEMYTDLFRDGQYGVMDVSGDVWRNHRRFAITQLRHLGLGKSVMEEKILLEVQEMIKSIDQNGPIVPNTQKVFDVAVGSIINQLLFSERFDDSRVEEMLTLRGLIQDQMRWFGDPTFYLITTFPKLRFLPYFKSVYAEVFKLRDTVFGKLQKQIDEHTKVIKTRSGYEEAVDYVEAYLREQQKREESGDVDTFSDKQLLNMCWDLWVAGLETVANTLAWLSIYLINHPHVQKKLYAELDRVIASDRLIAMSDKNLLPYTNAVINEAQRLANLLPINLIHTVNKDYKIGDHVIPSGTGVIAQISTVLYDEKLREAWNYSVHHFVFQVFPNHMEFIPERFLDEDGNIKKVDELIPFSVGKRQCLGEGLAKMELFLFVANLFNHFSIEKNDECPSMEKTFSMTVAAKKFSCKLVRRK